MGDKLSAGDAGVLLMLIRPGMAWPPHSQTQSGLRDDLFIYPLGGAVIVRLILPATWRKCALPARDFLPGKRIYQS
jgi:hypothetical protein